MRKTANVRGIMSNVTSNHTTHRELVASRLANGIWIYAGAILLLIGTVGNSLVLAVVVRSNLRKLTTSLYLIVLAVVDTAILYNGLMRYWIKEITGTDIRMASVSSCKVQTFFAYFLVQFEAWILVCVAFERMVAVFHPHRAKVIFTKRFAAIQITFTGLVLMVINLHFFWTHTLMHGSCLLSDTKFTYFADNIWKWLDFVLSSLGPFVLMVSFNVAIISRLIYLKYAKKRTTDVVSKRLNTMTAILITISFVFFLTTAPISFFSRRERHREEAAESDEEWAIISIVAYVNNAINFILYCLSGPCFRRELAKMLKIEKYLSKIHPVENNDTGNEGR